MKKQIYKPNDKEINTLNSFQDSREIYQRHANANARTHHPILNPQFLISIALRK
jgi:hypothetical protein